MSLTITHPFVSLVTDSGNTSLVQPSDWNDDHTITGVLDATEGGTGLSSYVVGDLIYANSTTTLTTLAAGTANYVLVSGGPGVAPTWAAGSTITALVVGTTTITGGATTRILYDNAGVLGEYTITGSGTVVAMQTSPRFITNIAPTANDGAALGTSALSWSDLFLASGGAIDWNNNAAAITHSSTATLTAKATTFSVNYSQDANTQISAVNQNPGASASASLIVASDFGNFIFQQYSAAASGLTALTVPTGSGGTGGVVSLDMPGTTGGTFNVRATNAYLTRFSVAPTGIITMPANVASISVGTGTLVVTGGVGISLAVFIGTNLSVGATSFGTSANNVIAMLNATAPTTSPANTGQIYVTGGALTYRGSSGTVTTIAPA